MSRFRTRRVPCPYSKSTVSVGHKGYRTRRVLLYFSKNQNKKRIKKRASPLGRGREVEKVRNVLKLIKID